MRNMLIAVVLSGTAFAGSAAAQTPPPAAGAPARGMGTVRADANGDGVVTRAEASAQADAQFEAMDANRDGKVTGEEMRAAFQARAAAAGAGGRFGGGRFGRGAGDAPGTDMALTREDMRARALTRFDRNDANHDGKVDQAEMAAARQMRMNRSATRSDGSGAPAPAPAPQQ